MPSLIYHNLTIFDFANDLPRRKNRRNSYYFEVVEQKQSQSSHFYQLPETEQAKNDYIETQDIASPEV